MKRFAMLALASSLLISISAAAKIDTVLSIVPHDAIGLIYAQSLKNLNQEISDLMAEMNPADPNRDYVAGVLSDMFEAGFESLADLEGDGFDMKRDFVLYIHQIPSETELVLSAVVHLADQDAAKQMIDAESGEAQQIDYNGVNYVKIVDESAYFSFLDDVMIYSKHQEVCEKTIDVYKKETPSILENHSFTSNLDLDDASNDLVGFIDRHLLAESSELVESLGTIMQLPLTADDQGMVSSIVGFFDQIQSITLTVQHDTGEFVVTPAMQLMPDSEIGNLFSSAKNDFSAILKFLPEQSSVNVGVGLELYKYLSNFGMKQLAEMNVLKSDNPATADVQLLFEDLNQSVEEFLNLVDDEVGMAMNFSGSVIPDQTFVFRVIDEGKIIMSLEEQLQKLDAFLQAVGVAETGIARVDNVVEVYEGVEIRRFNYNNLLMTSLVPDEISQNLMPSDYYYYYGIANGFLVASAAGTSSSIKSMIDRIFGFENGFDRSDGYTRIIDKLDANGDMILALSPVTLINQVIKVMAPSGGPNIGMMAVMFANMPQTYSIGTSVFSDNNVIKLRLFVSLLDLKDLYTIASAMMLQMPRQTFQ